MKKLKTPKIYFRGTIPGATRRIRTGAEWWDQQLFVARERESALMYGPSIEAITLQPAARVVREGARGLPRHRRGESLLAYAERAAKKAKELGFDVIEFNRDSDVGTVVLNPRVIAARSRED